MKKFLAILLALLMCVSVFAGCGKKKKGGDDAATLEQAKDYLYNVMKDKNGKALPNDYDVVGKIIIENTEFSVTWTTDCDDIKVKESTKANMWTIDLPEFNEEEFEYKLTATIEDADGETIEVTFTPKLPVIDNRGVTVTPEADKAYKIFLEQVDLGYTLYALNTTKDGQNKFINTTRDPKEAANFYMEAVDGGYKIYTMIDGVKNYVHATATAKTEGTGFTKAIGFATETDCVFVYDAEKLVWTVTINGETFGVGTYSEFDTISISEMKYFKSDNINVKDGQFPIGFMESAYAETLAPDEIPPHVHAFVDGFCECGEADPNATNNPDLILTATTMGLSAYADGSVTLGGIKFDYTELGTYGDGIQWRTKEGKTATLWNATAAPMGIEKIEITLAEGKYGYSNADALVFTFGDSADSLTYRTTVSTEAGTAKYTITPDVGTYTFFNIQHNISYTTYIERIAIYYTGAAPHVHNFVDGSCACGESDPDYVPDGGDVGGGDSGTTEVITSIAEANTAASGSAVVLTGVVVAADTWSTQYNNMSVTIKDESGATIYVYRLGTQVARGDKITVTGVIGVYNNANQVAQGATAEILVVHGDNHTYENGSCTVCEMPAPDAAPITSITEANTAADGSSVILTGVVVSADTWSTQYNNMSVTIKDESGATIYVYRLGTQVALGDKITVTGVIGVYSGSNQVAQGATAEILVVHGDNHTYENGSCTACGAADPNYVPDSGDDNGGDVGGGDVGGGDVGGDTGDDNNGGTTTVTTIPEALASAEGTAVVLSGTVVEIYQAWNDQYSNISVYIADADGNRILCYRLSTKVNIGDEITVTGSTTLYNETVQIAQGCTAVIDVAHVCSDFEDATCKSPAICTVCGKENGEIGTHNYVSGVCSVCGHEEGTAEAQTITASKTIASLITELGWTSSTTKQSFNLDDNVSVKIDGGANTGKAYSGDHIRIYATDTPAGTITISVEDGYELVGLKITTQTGTYAFLCLGDGTADISNEYTAVSGSSVVLNSVKNGENGKQVRVTAIEVEYKAV